MRTNAGLTIGYARVSTQQQSDGWSLTAQVAKMERYCTGMDWSLSTVVTDDGVSTRKRRPGLEELRSMVATGDVARIVVTKLDRLGRSVRELIDLCDEFDRHRIELVSIGEGIDTGTAPGRFLRTILAAVAELEREMVSERTKTAMAEARRRGVKMGRPILVSPALDTRIAVLRGNGLTLRAIAATLESEAVPAPGGGTRWGMETVRKSLARTAGGHSGHLVPTDEPCPG